MTHESQHLERIDLRITAHLKKLFNRAATYSGMSLSGFLVSVASDRATEIVTQHENITLSPEDWTVFLAACDRHTNRPHLQAAIHRYLADQPVTPSDAD